MFKFKTNLDLKTKIVNRTNELFNIEKVSNIEFNDWMERVIDHIVFKTKENIASDLKFDAYEIREDALILCSCEYCNGKGCKMCKAPDTSIELPKK